MSKPNRAAQVIGGLATRTGGPRRRWRSTRPAFRAAYLRQVGRCSPLRSRRDPACFRAWTLARPRRSLEQGARLGERCADRVCARRRSRCALDQRRAGYALVDGLGGRSGHLVRCAAVERGVPAVRAGGRLRIGEPGDARDRARAGRARRGSGGRRAHARAGAVSAVKSGVPARPLWRRGARRRRRQPRRPGRRARRRGDRDGIDRGRAASVHGGRLAGHVLRRGRARP